jgi:hypothetical protein
MCALLKLAQERLGWPSEQEIMEPAGAGPRVIAELAKRKIETAIRRENPNVNVNVGVLAANPRSNRTEDPLAIVCDFGNHIPDDVLYETHRLVWSFSRSPMLITVEPSLLRVWTCWKRPMEKREKIDQLRVEQLKPDLFEERSLSEQAARALQWVELASGSFFRNVRYSEYFDRDQRADQLMLEDLKELRKRLLAADLPEDICHDLIARVIFIEFLFQRKDPQGNAALNENVLRRLHEKAVLSRVHKDLPSILATHGETYAFFRELNDRFNGDLFPGKGETPQEREAEWRDEMRQVRAAPHLKLLGQFVSGKMEIKTGQFCLWRRYAFDVIPLEFISSIYEEFVHGKRNEKTGAVDKKSAGIHYTPGQLVDLILDEVLPWDGQEWDLKILDPACGSGIFLVKAYQRLVHRSENARGKPKVGDLRGLLEENLFGVDKERNAVRVASFSLYLAMCDEIEPKLVWQKNVQFPRLRDKRLIESDFFREDKAGFRTSQDTATYDLVIGNAPWGYASETVEGKRWAKMWGWPIPNRNLGPLFLPKSARLAKPSGVIVMLQPAGVLLFNRDSTAETFRERLFSEYKVDKVVNLSILRFGLFKNAISPACVVSMRPGPPDGAPLVYVCPKPSRTKADDLRIIVEPSDENVVFAEEVITDPEIWSTLIWGGRRDFGLIKRMKKVHTLGEIVDRKSIRKGIVRGGREIEEKCELVGRRIIEESDFPKGTLVKLRAADLPVNKDPFIKKGEGRNLRPFKPPQLILKKSWKAKTRRFHGVVVDQRIDEPGVVCSQSYVSVHVPEAKRKWLDGACLMFNSTLAVYYLYLTSGRCAAYIPEALKKEILGLPVVAIDRRMVDSVEAFADADAQIRKTFGLTDAEWVLVEDLFNYTLPDFKGGLDSPGRRRTRDVDGKGQEQVLRDYCMYFKRVLLAGFGGDKRVSATIFTEGPEAFLPVRLVAMHLEASGKPFIRVERIDSAKLIERLRDLDKKFLRSAPPADGGIFYQRVARVYDTRYIGGKGVPTVFIVKPDQVRYWTRSMGMRDADEIAADVMLWREGEQPKSSVGGKILA